MKIFDVCYIAITAVTSAIPRRIEIPSEKSFAICAKLSRNCHCKIYRTVAVCYVLRGISRIAIASHAGTIYFYLGRKSPVVMEIYRGLNIDINARQRRRRSRMMPKSRSKIFARLSEIRIEIRTEINERESFINIKHIGPRKPMKLKPPSPSFPGYRFRYARDTRLPRDAAMRDDLFP